MRTCKLSANLFARTTCGASPDSPRLKSALIKRSAPYDLPDDGIRAIPMLRKLLGTETGILSRHFMYLRLEDMLYRARDTFASALDEYDEACRQHDAEMDGIRQACIDKWGEVPLLDIYRQMAIGQAKAGDYGQALWWAERGLSIYGSDCGRPRIRRRPTQASREIPRQARPLSG
jgi:hypothetical protein